MQAWQTMKRNIGDTTPVNRYMPNRYGLYDMSGNVDEWCFDAYDETFYANSPHRNPVAGGQVENNFTSINANRVLRGGGWNDSAQFLRVANRNRNMPTFLVLKQRFSLRKGCYALNLCGHGLGTCCICVSNHLRISAFILKKFLRCKGKSSNSYIVTTQPATETATQPAQHSLSSPRFAACLHPIAARFRAPCFQR